MNLLELPFYHLPNFTYHTLTSLTPLPSFLEQAEYNPIEPAACNDLILDIYMDHMFHFGESCSCIILLESSLPATIYKMASSGHTPSLLLYCMFLYCTYKSLTCITFTGLFVY